MSAPLVAYLKQHIESNLLKCQIDFGGTEKVQQLLVDLAVKPTSNPYQSLSHANARLAAVTEQLKLELTNETVFPWIIPRLASLAVEGIFELCVAYWITRGQPADASQLKPEVKEFVDWNVRAFAAAVGAK